MCRNEAWEAQPTEPNGGQAAYWWRSVNSLVEAAEKQNTSA